MTASHSLLVNPVLHVDKYFYYVIFYRENNCLQARGTCRMAEEETYYERQLRSILHQPPYVVDITGPTQILDHLYIGNYTDAYSHEKLRDLGITHVINCAAFSESEESPYDEDSGVVCYKQFHAQDDDRYDMMQHLKDAKECIDSAKEAGGKTLVHCAMGINRSGLIVVAYIMLSEKMNLLECVRFVKSKRGTILCNRGFQTQLISFAMKEGLLQEDMNKNIDDNTNS